MKQFKSALATIEHLLFDLALLSLGAAFMTAAYMYLAIDQLVYKAVLISAGALHAHVIVRRLLKIKIETISEREWYDSARLISAMLVYVFVIDAYARGG